MKKLYIIHGLSSSGKTEVCKYLNEKYNFCLFHPYGFRKRQLESLYNLPYGALDTRQGKNFVPIGSKYSMQQIMVAEYHFWAEHDPCFTSRNIPKELSALLNIAPVAANAIRNLAEVRAIKEVVSDVTLIEIKRDKSQQESSDYMADRIKKEFLTFADEYAVIDNNGSLAELFEKIDNVLF